MKKLLDEIVASKYKWWLIGMLAGALIVALISAIVTGSNVTETLLIGVIVSLFINLASSLVTIVFIEERDRRELRHIESHRQNAVISKLINAVKRYNGLFANIYKATLSGEISDMESLCANLYYDNEGFAEQLNRLDFAKDSYVAPFGLGQNGKVKAYSWIELFIYETQIYVESMHSIHENYLFCLTDDALIEPLSGIASLSDIVKRGEIISMIKTHPNIFEQVKIENNLLFPGGIEIKIVYIMFKSLDTIAHTKDLMHAIDEITGKVNFAISSSMFTAGNTAPGPGSGVDERYIRKRMLEKST